jgi:hypothetical protein
MILLLGAMTLVGPDRPGALLGTASAETYSAWLAKTAIETEDMANGAGSEVCASAAAKSLGWRATEDPYLAPIVARYGTASIIEKVRVTGVWARTRPNPGCLSERRQSVRRRPSGAGGIHRTDPADMGRDPCGGGTSLVRCGSIRLLD